MTPLTSRQSPTSILNLQMKKVSNKFLLSKLLDSDYTYNPFRTRK